jgi:hypothetical protein
MGVLFYELARTPVEAIGLAPLYLLDGAHLHGDGLCAGPALGAAAACGARTSGPQPLRVVAVRVLEPTDH